MRRSDNAGNHPLISLTDCKDRCGAAGAFLSNALPKGALRLSSLFEDRSGRRVLPASRRARSSQQTGGSHQPHYRQTRYYAEAGRMASDKCATSRRPDDIDSPIKTSQDTRSRKRHPFGWRFTVLRWSLASRIRSAVVVPPSLFRLARPVGPFDEEGRSIGVRSCRAPAVSWLRRLCILQPVHHWRLFNSNRRSVR